MISISEKKGEEKLAMRKIIIVILVLLVIGIVLLFVFKVDLLAWVKNLPQWQYNETDRKLDADELPKSYLARIGCNKIARLGSDNKCWIGDCREVLMYDGEKVATRNIGKKEGIYMKTDNEVDKYELIITKASNIKLGYVKNAVIIIDSNLIENYNYQSRGLKDIFTDAWKYEKLRKFISLEDLKTLNGTRLVGNNLLCEIVEQTEENEIEEN